MKRIQFPEDIFYNRESVFPEIVFLYSCALLYQSSLLRRLILLARLILLYSLLLPVGRHGPARLVLELLLQELERLVGPQQLLSLLLARLQR